MTRDARQQARGAVHGFLDYTTPLWRAIGIGLSILFFALGLFLLVVVLFG